MSDTEVFMASRSIGKIRATYFICGLSRMWGWNVAVHSGE